MLRNLGPRAGLGLAALVLSAIFGVSSANAAVTSSHVTVPSSPSFFQENQNNTMDPAHQITISGTTTNNGTAGNVDLVCTFQNTSGTSDSTIQSNVPVGPSGSFTFSGPVPNFERACVIRAVPAGGPLPTDLSPFTGPTVGLGGFFLSKLTAGPNTGNVFTFDDQAAQLTGAGNYHSLGGGGIFDAFPIQPGTLVLGADMYFGGDYVSDANADRSDLEIDGVPAYAAATAEDLITGSENFSGLPSITFSTSQDPTTGDLTVHESETLVKCEPAPATYPATATSCTSFASTGVKFERTIVQDQGGRQAHFTDTYSSSDGQAHSLDLRYGQDFDNADAGFNFPWVDGGSYNTHAAGDTIAPPPSAPATVFVNFDNTKSSGDLTSAQGAITFAQAPSALNFLAKGLSATNGDTHLFASFARSIPAGGSATLRTAYSWAYTIADAHTLAATAEQSFTAPGATTGSASSITTTGASVSGSVNPNAQATTYQFQFGTSTSYGSSTAVTSAGSGTSATAVSSALTGLKPNTTYHYRIVATNATGTTNGADATFKTKNIATRLTVGKVKVKGNTASVPLSCAGNPGVKCKGTLTETIKVKAKHNKKKTVTVGKASFSIAAAGKKTVKVTLNSKGRKALAKAKSHKLRAKLTVKLGSKKVASKTVTFKHKGKHKKK
jgi:hypothetical protein